MYKRTACLNGSCSALIRPIRAYRSKNGMRPSSRGGAAFNQPAIATRQISVVHADCAQKERGGRAACQVVKK